MKNRGTITNNSIKKILKRHLDGEIESIQGIETGLFNGTFVISLKSTLRGIKPKPGNDSELILRISPPDDAGFLFYEKQMMKQEPRIHKLFRDFTEVPIPKIYVFDNSREIINRDFLIMEKLNGTALSSAYWITFQDRRIILEKIGKHLREVHNIHAKKYGYLGPHQPMIPQKSWWAAFKIMWSKMIEDIYRCGFYNEGEKAQYIKLLELKKSHFESRNTIPSSLLHMDIWGQNILVTEEAEITGIIDWDRALWGDPEIEYAVLRYCGIAKSDFWKGYGQQRNTNRSSKIRDLFYLLYEHQKYIPINYLRRNDKLTAQRYTHECKQLFRKLQTL
jgi:aminoglycoside phosphotransferase (APT) family kinase protein